jgi:ATP-dependent DNA helicase PIF1
MMEENNNLSKLQQLAFDKYLQGQNIFITGSAGTGKTYLIKQIYKHATENNKNIQICALTGCASILLNCNARTIHSWAGIGLGNGTIQENINKVIKAKPRRNNWIKYNILVIDEVSMMSLKLFDMLFLIGQAVRHSMLPFGGLQIIMSGDFFQLSPVGSCREPDTQRFCFESENWKKTFLPECHIELTEIFRQTDPYYCDILNQIRKGYLFDDLNKVFAPHITNVNGKLIPVENNCVPPKLFPVENNCVPPKLFPVENNCVPPKLFPTKDKVEKYNNQQLEKIINPEIIFKSKHIYDLKISKKQKEIRDLYSKYEMDKELEYIENNLPITKILKLKIGAQVMSIINIYQIKDGKSILEICNGSQGKIIDIRDNKPVIRFQHLDYDKVIENNIWGSEKIPGIGISHIPIILSWALTIHKCQGATLETAEIDIGSEIFECGQTYVALSRVKSLNGLYLTSFDKSKILINRKVREFYEKMNS